MAGATRSLVAAYKGLACRASLTLLLILFIACFARGESPQPSDDDRVDRIIAHLKEGSELPRGVRFRQDVTLRILLATWRFQSVFENDGEQLRVTTTGAPSFVPDSLAADLIDLVRAPSLFDLAVEEEEESGADAYIVLKGPRVNFEGSGPSEATFWVNPATWVVDKASAVYSWGTLTVDQEYSDNGGHRLLDRQRARVTPFGFTLDVEYYDYRF